MHISAGDFCNVNFGSRASSGSGGSSSSGEDEGNGCCYPFEVSDIMALAFNSKSLP